MIFDMSKKKKNVVKGSLEDKILLKSILIDILLK